MTDVLGQGIFRLVGDADSLEAAFAKAETVARRAETTVTQSVQKTNQATSGLGKGVAPELDNATRATQRYAEKLLLMNAQNELSVGGYHALKAAIKGADVDALAPMIQRLQATVDKQTAAAASSAAWAKNLNLVGVSAKQANVALQQMPAQITDIVTSLASGQNPLLVLIQQGGQIKDSFGGIGNSLRALGSLLTPARLAIGGVGLAVGLVAEAYREGAVETDNYRKAIALTGNQAGETIGQLQGMAKAVSAATGSTQGKAAEVLTQLAGSADVAGNRLQALTDAAIRLERAGGPAAEETAKAFAALAKTPTAASLKLTEQTGFLTAALYEQIHALEKQGKTAEAAGLAQSAAAQDAEKKAKQLEAGLGPLQKAWRDLGDVAKGAWDKMVGIGRPESVQDQLAAAAAALAKAQKLSALPAFGSSPIASTQAGAQNYQSANAAAGYEALSAYYERLASETDKAKIKFSQLAESVQLPNKALADQVAQVRNLGEQGKLTAKEVADLEVRIRSLSQVNSISIATQQARLAAQQAIESAKASAAMQEAQHQREMGYATEIGFLTRVGELQIKIAEQEKARAESELKIARQLPAEQSGAATVKAQADIAAADIRLQVARKDAIDQVTEAIYRRKLAADVLMASEREQWRQETALAGVKTDEIIASFARSEQAYAFSLDNATFALERQTAAALLNDREREIAVRQLQVELELKRKIRSIEASGLSGADQSDLIEVARRNAKTASDQVVSEVTKTFAANGARQITDSLVSALENGFDSAWNYLRSLLKRQVLEVAVRPLVASFVGGVSSAFAADGGSSGGGSAFGALGTSASLYSAGSKIYEGFAAGFSSLGNTVANAYGTAYANATGGGLDAMLATNNAYGTAGGAGGAGAAFGTAASYAAGAAAGIYGGRAISGGYSAVGDSGNTAVNVGTAIGALWGPIGAALGGLAGGVVNRAFGRSAPEVESRQLRGTFSGSGFAGEDVTTILSRGGWFRSDKRSELISAVTGDLDKALDDGAAKVTEMAKTYARALGLPAEQFAAVTQQVTVEISGSAVDELSKKYGEALNKPFSELSDAAKRIVGTSEYADAVQKDLQANTDAVSRALGLFGNALLESFSSALRPLANVGETAAQTIERVGGAIVSVNDVMRNLGHVALTASIEGGKAALSLQDAFGGLSTLQQAASGYLQNFYTDAERANLTRANISGALADFGLQLPATREAFRSLVDAQDLMTESGRQAFAALMGVQDAFAGLTDVSKTASEAAKERAQLDKQLYELQGNTAALRQIERDALDESNRALYDQIEALKDQKTAADSAAEAAKKEAEAQRSLWASVDSAIGKFLSPSQQIEYGYTTTANSLRAAGVLADVPDLAGVLKGATRQQIFDFAKSFVELGSNSTEAKAAVVAAASALADLADRANELIRAGLQKQLDAITSQYGDVVGVLDETEKLTDAYARNKAEARSLREGLDNLLGRSVQTVQQALADALQGQRALQSYRGGSLASAIESARLGAMMPADRVAAMRATEARLFSGLASAADPVSLAQQLQSTIIDRIKLESSLQQDASGKQIDALKSMRSLAEDLRQFTADMRIGDSSPLSYEQQLSTARQLYEDTIAKAKAGDTTAQGALTSNARTFLDEARSYYASSAAYADIFAQVTGSLDSMAAAGVNLDPQIAALEAVQSSVDDGSQRIYEALTQVDSSVAALQTIKDSQVADLVKKAEEQIAKQDKIIEGQEAQIRQWAAIAAALQQQLERNADASEATLAQATLVSAGP